MSKEQQLTHVGPSGSASMVDVGQKKRTSRGAIAVGKVLLGAEAYNAVRQNQLAKGDVIATARLAGIMAAKQTQNLIPLCHSLNLDRCAFDMQKPLKKANAKCGTRALEVQPSCSDCVWR